MKQTKKLASLLLALVMVLSLATTVFAANISNATDHSYSAYQIFSGTQAENSVPLGDVEWGSGINGATFLAELKTDSRLNVGESNANIFSSCTTAVDVAAVLGNYKHKSDVANAFANVAAKHLTTTSTAIAAGANSVDLAAGYYLLVDTSTPSTGDAMNSALLQVTNKGDITIEKKYDVPTVDKSAKDTDGNWGESADWEIGSDVPFQIVGKLPSNYADYETYKYVFHDTLSAAFKLNATFDESTTTKVVSGVTVKINGVTDITSAFDITYSDNKLTISCSDLKTKVPGLNSANQIVIDYKAKLLSTAEIGQPGNKNEVYLEYSNNPNATGDGTPSTSDTPKDEVLVFTYELDVIKVDGQNADNKLANAEFVLLNSDKTKVAKVTGGKFVEWVAITNAVDGKIAYPEGTTLTSGADGKFVIAGLDAGSYFLRETKAPAGYNLLKDDIAVVITAILDKSENSPALTTLTIQIDGGAAVNGNLGTGVVSADVKNNSGATLPETGGIGTTIFYIVGGVLFVGAAVLLIVKRRMSMKG